MNCAAAKRMIDADDFDRGIDDFALRTHLEECRACRAEFPEVLFLMREGGRESAPLRRQPPLWPRFAVAAAAAVVLYFSFRPPSSTVPTFDRGPDAPRSATALSEQAADRHLPVAALDRSRALGVLVEGTLRPGRKGRTIDSTTVGGVLRPAEIGPRHIPLPRKQ